MSADAWAMMRPSDDPHVHALIDLAEAIEDCYVKYDTADEEAEIADGVRVLALRLAEWRYGARERERLSALHCVVTPLAEARYEKRRRGEAG